MKGNARMTTRRPKSVVATADQLLLKPARSSELKITVPGEKGDQELVLKLRAVSAAAYDEMLASHPPTKDQKADGQSYNADAFAPDIIAAVVEEPKLSLEQATELWTSDTWSRGELRDLFMACVNLCSKGLDVPFIPAD